VHQCLRRVGALSVNSWRATTPGEHGSDGVTSLRAIRAKLQLGESAWVPRPRRGGISTNRVRTFPHTGCPPDSGDLGQQAARRLAVGHCLSHWRCLGQQARAAVIVPTRPELRRVPGVESSRARRLTPSVVLI
jgi:hypothetical protein